MDLLSSMLGGQKDVESDYMKKRKKEEEKKKKAPSLIASLRQHKSDVEEAAGY